MRIPSYSSDTWLIDDGQLHISVDDDGHRSVSAWLLVAMDNRDHKLVRAECVPALDELSGFLTRASIWTLWTPSQICLERPLMRYLSHWGEHANIDICEPQHLDGPMRAMVEQTWRIIEKNLMAQLRATYGIVRGYSYHITIAQVNECLADVLNVDFRRYFGDQREMLLSSPRERNDSGFRNGFYLGSDHHHRLAMDYTFRAGRKGGDL